MVWHLGMVDSSTGNLQNVDLGNTLAVTGTTLDTVGGGSGDVVGPASSTDSGFAKFDGTTGKLLKNSAATIAQADVTGLVTDLSNKQPLDSDLTTIAGLTATTDNFMVAASSAWASRTPAQAKTSLALNNVDNTSDANKPVSTATQTALDLKVNITSPAFLGNPTAPTPSVGDNDTSIATTAYVRAAPIDTLGAPTDITTLNATTSQHGLLPKLGGGTTNFLRADGTWSAPTAAVSATEVEVDWGNNLTQEDFLTFTIVDAAVTTAHKILLSLSYEAATGRDQDENDMDTFTLAAAAGTGSFTLAMHSLNGPAHGVYKIVYSLAA